MGKKRSSVPKPGKRLSALAENLLRDMATNPSRIEYNTRVLGGMFREDSVDQLDEAYHELAQGGLVDPAGAVVSFFGTPKSLFKVNERGLKYVSRVAA